jgi:hypothetical protein
MEKRNYVLNQNVYLFIFEFSGLFNLLLKILKYFLGKIFMHFIEIFAAAAVWFILHLDWFYVHIFHVEAIYSLICWSFVSYARNAVFVGFLRWLRPILASLLTLLSDICWAVLNWRSFVQFWIEEVLWSFWRKFFAMVFKLWKQIWCEKDKT